MTVLVDVVGGVVDPLREGQQSGRLSSQPMMGASTIPPPLMTIAVYIGIVHVPTSSAWPVYGVVGNVTGVEDWLEVVSDPVALVMVLGEAEGTITLVKLNVWDWEVVTIIWLGELVLVLVVLGLINVLLVVLVGAAGVLVVSGVVVEVLGVVSGVVVEVVLGVVDVVDGVLVGAVDDAVQPTVVPHAVPSMQLVHAG
jgi:hypothetical protein